MDVVDVVLMQSKKLSLLLIGTKTIYVYLILLILCK
jgi:hypothetical protein